MTIISTEMLKWKRNKTVLGIFILTAILGIFAVERAFSISRSSSLMNSFSDLYTLAFKNLTSLFLPIVLSMFATTLFFDEQKNDTLKGLLIIPISKTQLYFSKIAVVIFMSLALCLLTFAICILGGFLAGGFTDLNTETILQAGLLFLAGGVLVPLAMLPVIFLATLAKGYVLPIGAALLYLVPVVLIPSGIMGLHPLASVMGIYPYISSDAAEMVASTGAEYVILGHSERRAYYHETVEILEEKVKLALANNLKPIFCIGEVLEEREANKQNEVVAAQLASVFSLSAEDFSKIILAYEPVWAIGTGKTATAEQAQEIHAFIRSLIADKYGKEVADNTSILYGGSCKPSNAKELFANPDVDGGLIGGAALKVVDFKGIIDAFK